MKSLHERLRKWADETCPLNSAFADCGIDLIGYDEADQWGPLLEEES